MSVPYGCLVPRTLEGLLVIVRRGEPLIFREIPHRPSRGAAAGVSARLGVASRAVPIGEVQAELARQGVFLRQPAKVAV